MFVNLSNSVLKGIGTLQLVGKPYLSVVTNAQGSMTTYETVIGLEVHVQLNTRSKAFCGDANEFGRLPNTQTSVVSLAHPGTLPRANRSQIEKAVRLGLALNGQINPSSSFDRKNYFYADLPKGYQITQDKTPIVVGGALDAKIGQEWKAFRIHHIHMEEDAGKSIHTDDPDHSLIDLNRAGVPLVEIVTQPDLRSAEEVDAFMSAMRQLVRYLDVSDGNMEEGSLRCDINISLRPLGSSEWRERCEIKNVNSMRYARQAIAYEVDRQKKIYDRGGHVRQQTLNFDPVSGVTSPLREKEDAHDYRYFPEPDLPPVILSKAWIEEEKRKLPQLPKQWYDWLTGDVGLHDYDATLLTNEQASAALFSSVFSLYPHAKSIANVIINRLFSFCQENQMEIGDLKVTPEQLAAFIRMIDDGLVSNSIAYQRVFPEWMQAPSRNPVDVAKFLNVLQNSDEDTLEALARNIIQKNPDKVAAYKKGKKGLLGFFMGQLMRASKGKADPKIGNQLFQKLLDD